MVVGLIIPGVLFGVAAAGWALWSGQPFWVALLCYAAVGSLGTLAMAVGLVLRPASPRLSAEAAGAPHRPAVDRTAAARTPA